MTTIRITLSSASYDDDQSFVVLDTPKVRKALALRQEVIDESGDGSQQVVVTDAAPDTDEAAFLDAIVTDIAYDDEAEIYAAIEEAAR